MKSNPKIYCLESDELKVKGGGGGIEGVEPVTILGKTGRREFEKAQPEPEGSETL